MEVRDPSEYLAYVIRMVSGAMSHEVEQALRPVRLTQVQLAALVQLSRRGSLSAAELSRRCGVTPQSMATALAGLERRSLITRRPHPSHGRIVTIDVSAEGKALAARAQRMTAGVHAKAQVLLEPDQRRQLHALLLAVAAGLGLPIEHEQLANEAPG